MMKPICRRPHSSLRLDALSRIVVVKNRATPPRGNGPRTAWKHARQTCATTKKRADMATKHPEDIPLNAGDVDRGSLSGRTKWSLSCIRAARRHWLCIARSHARACGGTEHRLAGRTEGYAPRQPVRARAPLSGASIHRGRAVAPRRGSERQCTPNGHGAHRDPHQAHLIGRPIASGRAIHERLTKVKALAVLSSDALSSVAYATESTLQILVLAGVAAFGFTIPISLVIAALLAIVALSYRQTIFAYPSGGGAYIVARENLGTLPGLIAAASLLIDYILTVSVSVSAGVLAVVSAGCPRRTRFRSALRLSCSSCSATCVASARAARSSPCPTYVFIVSLLVLIVVGLVRVLMLHDPAATNGVPREAFQAQENLGIFLILRAFASGCTALTGRGSDLERHPGVSEAGVEERRHHPYRHGDAAGHDVPRYLGPCPCVRPRAARRTNRSISQMASQVFGGMVCRTSSSRLPPV